MEINDLIQKFSDSRENQQKAIFSTLFIAGNRLQTLFDHQIPDVTLKQFMLLSLVRQAPEPQTFTKLGELLGCSRQNVKKLAAALEKKGFVTCRTSEKDHRCKVVSATERAHELHHAIGVFDDRVFTALCRGLSEGEVAEFLRITDVMLENAKNMNDAREPFPCGRGCDAE